MLDKNFIYILTSLQCIESTLSYAENLHTANDFLWANRRMNYNAALSQLLVLGEEIKKIDNILKVDKNIPWRAIQGLRNRIAHDYRGTDFEVIFDIVKNELSPLKNALILMLEKITIDENDFNEILKSPYYSDLIYLKNKYFL